MSSLKLKTPSGGSVLIDAIDTATNNTLTIPPSSGMLVTDTTMTAAIAGVMTGYATTASLGAYQPLLVSGTNIKTINTLSILGSGNLDVIGGLKTTTVKTANYQAVTNDLVRVDTTSGTFTVTMPVSPADGDKVGILDIGNTCSLNPLSVATASSKSIEGDASGLSININGSQVLMIFNSATDQWKIQETPSLVAGFNSANSNPVRQIFTASAAQTTFTVTGGYTPNYLDVYLNGSKVGGSGVDVTNGTTVVFATPLLSGAEVEVVGYKSFVVNGMVSLAGTETITNKTYVSPIITGTTSTSGQITSTYSATAYGAFNWTNGRSGYTYADSGGIGITTSIPYTSSTMLYCGPTALYAYVGSSPIGSFSSIGLDVAGRISVSSGNVVRVYRPDNATYGDISHGVSGTGIIYNDANGDGHVWRNSGADVLTINSSGNLGIGVIPSDWYSAYKCVQIGSIGSASLFTGGYDAQLVSNLFASGSGTYKQIGASWKGAVYSQFDSMHRWYTTTNVGANTTVVPTLAMILDSTGTLTLGDGSSTNGNLILNSASAGSNHVAWANGGILKFAMGRNVGSGGAGDLAIYNYATSSNSLIIDGTTNVLILPSGQIKFPASQNASSDANTMDDYEEGTWTPVLAAVSAWSGTPTMTGEYQKVGGWVHLNGRIYGTVITGSGPFSITGLPFSKTNGPCVGAGWLDALSLGANYTHVAVYTSGGTSMSFYKTSTQSTASLDTQIQMSEISTVLECYFSITYRAA